MHSIQVQSEGKELPELRSAISHLAGSAEVKTLSFKNLSYNVTVTVEKKEEVKPIVRNVSGSVKGGSMMCILGPSGSGKTSLLNIISGKLTADSTHDISGQVRDYACLN